jgi:hypothetical protein
VAGAEILRRQALLQRLGMDEDTSRLTNSLVEVHGLMGHVLLGEVALPALDLVTSSGNEQLFEAFFIHSVLAAAAYREGIMAEDLLDRFLDLRQVALDVIGGETSWPSYLDKEFKEKGRSLLTDMDTTGSVPGQLALFSEWDSSVAKHSHHLKGKDTAAIERLFRLVGLPDIDFVDIQMKILDMPVSFVYHKKGLKSTGLQKFEEDLQRAMVVHQDVVGLPDTIRRYLLDQLNPSRDSIRIYGLGYVARHLTPENWLKLLILAFRGLDRFCPDNDKPRVVDFHDLSHIIDRRYQAIAEELATLPVDRLFEDSSLLSRLTKASVGIILSYNPDEGVVKPLYQDRLQIQLVLKQMQEQQEILRLKNFYHRELKKLRNYTYHTEDYQKLLSDSFHERLQKLIEQALKDLQKRMRQQRSFSGIERVFTELMALAEENAFSEEQIQLVTDMYEFNRDRLRSRRLETIYREIHGCSTTAELFELWQKIRVELVNNQSDLGKEFEDLVTSRFDQQIKQLERS